MQFSYRPVLNYYYIVSLLISISITPTSSSAIPMWEFLAKQEKTDILSGMIVDLVEQLCVQVSSSTSSNTIISCGSMLSAAVDKLNQLSENEIDELDPFQRNAQMIIWNSLIDKQSLRYNYNVDHQAQITNNHLLDEEFNNFFDKGTPSDLLDSNSLSNDQNEQESQIIEAKVLPENGAAKYLFSKFIEKLGSVYTRNLEHVNQEIRVFPNGSHVPDEINEIPKHER